MRSAPAPPVWIYDRGAPDGTREYFTETRANSFKGGKKYAQVFGKAVLGPSVPEAPGFGLARFEDQTTLFLNGTKLGEQPRARALFDVPPRKALTRLRSSRATPPSCPRRSAAAGRSRPGTPPR
jgi:hypothetical protein